MRSPSLFVLAFVLLLIAVYTLRSRPTDATNRWFSVFTLCIAGWVTGIAGVQTGAQTEFWGRITFASSCLIPPSFLAFTRAFPTKSSWPAPFFLRAALLLGLMFSVASAFTPLVAHDISLTEVGIERDVGPLFPLFSIYLVACSAAALGIFFVKWHSARGIERAQLQHLGIGLTVFALGATTTNLLIPTLTGRSHYSWIGPYFAIALIGLAGRAILRHRLLDLRIVVHRWTVHFLAVSIVSVSMFIILRSVPMHLLGVGSMVRIEYMITALVAVVLLLAPRQWGLGRLIDKYLHRNQLDYAAELRRATRHLSRLMLPNEIAQELRSILVRCFSTESCLLVIETSAGQAQEQFPPHTLSRAQLADCNRILPHLFDASGRSSVVTGSVFSAPMVGERAHNLLSSLGFEVAVPLSRRDRRLGTILLGARVGGEPYYVSELEFIESLAEVTAIAIDNALLYRQRIEIFEYSERLLESLNSAVVAIDASGTITSANPAACRLFNISNLESGVTFDALPSEVSWALLLTLKASWHTWETEVRIEIADRVLQLVLSTAALRDDTNRTLGALVVATDVSTVRALEHNQRRLEHLTMMARFYAGIAHEIRTPLTSISNFISMLSDHFDDPEYRDTATRLLPPEVARITALADRLRLMAPSEGGTLRPIDLTQLMRDIVALQASATEIRNVKVRLGSSHVPKVLGDEHQLVQLFLNLLNNAVEAMPEGGDIEIEVRTIPVPTNQQVVVRVVDNGTGVDASIRQQIFEPFFTTKPSGTGLGLSICREIAEFHRAKLSLLPRDDRRGTIAQVEFAAIRQTEEANYRTLDDKEMYVAVANRKS